MSLVRAPALRYHGGKFRLAPWLLQFFPEHRCYVEPFGGAAGVLLQKPRSYAEVYNDLDGDIVSLFRVLRDRDLADELIRQIQLTPYAREEFELAYQTAAEPVERARRCLIRSGMGFGSAGATKGKTGFRIDTSRKYGTAQQLWSRTSSALSPVIERLQEVLIENRPAVELIPQHDSAETLFYVDPPYVLGTRKMQGGPAGYYRYEMSDDEHIELLQLLRNVRGMVVLSGYPNAIYEKHLADWECHATRSRIAAGRGGGSRTECVWLNPTCTARLTGGLFHPQRAPALQARSI